MRTLASAFAFAFSFALAVSAVQAKNHDKEKNNAAPTATAAKEVTLSGDMVCGKCSLKESKKCQNVLKVKDGAKETKYYLADSELAKKKYEPVCNSIVKATVKGTVTDEGGKKILTASDIKYN